MVWLARKLSCRLELATGSVLGPVSCTICCRNACAQGLNHQHEREGQQQRPAQAKSELRTGYRPDDLIPARRESELSGVATTSIAPDSVASDFG
jgi:hypothetical protein